MLLSACLLLALFRLSSSNMFDVLFPKYTSRCKNGCEVWSNVNTPSYNQSTVNQMWEKGAAYASNFCGMPANTAGNHECDCSEKDQYTFITDSYAGPWCFCKNPEPGENQTAYCDPPKSVVEQLNLQLAGKGVVVASFVTYNEQLPENPPVAMFGQDQDNLNITAKGVTHSYKPPGREYLLHFVKLDNLEDRKRYYYKVKSGSDSCDWSPVYSFRAPYEDGVTRIATYGDMGHSHYNNMQNMIDDCANGGIDAIVHMGDHAYNLGMSNDRRGDAYMNAFSPVLSGCPWFPIIGNHERDDGDHFNRYLNITWGEIFGNDPPTKSTATSALGHLLGKGTMYGAGVHGPSRSLTSRYVSMDLGLIHIIGLDLNNLDEEQLAWLEEDLKLANSNRNNVPWIMASSHFPIYHSKLDEESYMSAASYLGEAGEDVIEGQTNSAPDGGHRFTSCAQDEKECFTIKDWQDAVSSKLEPLLIKYGVDIYNAGHVHDYCSTFPMMYGKVTQQNFDNPRAPVHITEGNGGVPGVVGTYDVKSCNHSQPWCRAHGTGGAYGRITIFNHSVLQYEHVQNNGGNVTDIWVLRQDSHGPF